MVAVDFKATWQRGDFTLNAEFTCPEGVTGIFGPSGAGKTSAAHLIAGLAKPHTGQIAADGTAFVDTETGTFLPPEKRRIGYVFQDARLFPHMSVARNLRYGEKLAPPEAQGVGFDEVIELLGLEALLERGPASLSGGERQRVAIGRALLMRPKLLIMDEPLANLDTARRGEILPFLEAVKTGIGLPIIYITHNLGELVRLSDHCVLMQEGTVAASGPAEEVLSRFDLRDLIDPSDGGTVMLATAGTLDPEDSLLTLHTPAGPLFVPSNDVEEGHEVHVRIRGKDVALATEQPDNISVLNVFEGTVSRLEDISAAQADVLLDLAGGITLWARITHRSARELGLSPGRKVFALIKAVAIERGV